MELLEQVLFETERLSERERDLPAHVMVDYIIALALYAVVSTREVGDTVANARFRASDMRGPLMTAGDEGELGRLSHVGVADFSMMVDSIIALRATGPADRRT